ncbi:MAG: hypothetical protein CSB47_03865 [Proteobacteria bacterium]|nr:MAG: hypothetical protein CSB47_03865 [Pseudomonadota bacterium]
MGVALVILLGLVSIVGSGGDSKSKGDSGENETTLGADVVLLPQDEEPNVSNKQLLESGNVSFDVSSDYLDTTKLSEGNVIHIPAKDGGQFPLGISGKVEKLSKDASSTTVTLSPVKLSEVVESSSIKSTPVNLTGDNLVAVISPKAIREAAANGAGRLAKLNRSDPAIYKSFLDGAVTVSRSSLLKQRDTFLGGSGTITPDTVNLDFKIPLKDMVDEPSRLKALGTGAETEVTITGSLSDLVIEEGHDVSLSEGLKSIKLSVSGVLSAKVELKGGVSYTAGYYSRAWKEVEEDQFEQLGQTAQISGLDGKDKVGKYPVAGLVFSIECPVSCKYALGKTQSPIRKAKKGGVIVWVYLNAKGELTFSSHLGVEANIKFQLGAEKKEGGKLTNISYLDNTGNPEHDRVLKAPYFGGKVNLTADLGVSVDADFFVFGIRPGGLGLDAIGRFSGGLKTITDANYGLTNFGGDWSWEAGKICTEASLGGGVMLSSAFDFGYKVEVDVGFYEETIEGNPTYFGQWPTDEEAANPGWSGLGDKTWYTGSAYNRCYPPLAAPALTATPRDQEAQLDWELDDHQEEGLTYDLCYAKSEIDNPLKCTEEGGVRVAGVKPGYVVKNLTNDLRYHFIVTARYEYVVIQNKREEIAHSNQVEATPNAEASISVRQLVFVTEGEEKKVKYQAVRPPFSSSKITCVSELGNSVDIVNDEYVFTAPNVPSGAEKLKFKITCTLAYGDGKSVSDESLITVSKDESEPPVDEAPTVKLPDGSSKPSGARFIVTPTVTDEDKSSLEYRWLVQWNTNDGPAGAAGSLSSPTLRLDVPELDPGQSGYVTVKLTVTDAAGQTASDSVTYTYRLDKYLALSFISDDFVDGETLERGSKSTLTWKVKNVGNVDLQNVALYLSETAENLVVGNISPAQVGMWAVGETKVFSVEVEVPDDVVGGNHRQEWQFTHDDGEPLSYKNQSGVATIFFDFVTEAPSDLLARLLINSTHIQASDTVYGAVEIHSGNAPYSVTVDWGDGSAVESFTEITDDYTLESKAYARQALQHKYGSDGTYDVVVNVSDAAGKAMSPPLEDQVTVSSTQVTEWSVDVRDVSTSEHSEGIAVTSDSYVHEGTGITAGKYATNWSPSTDPDSEEYFVKYRLPVPKNVLSLSKNLRITASVLASDIVAHDREFAFRTQSGKEYTAAIVDIGHGKGGYLRKRDMTTDAVDLTRYPVLVDDVKDTKYASYELVIEPSQMAVWSRHANEDENQELAVYSDALENEFVSEIDITFKGNGAIKAVVLQYDKNGDGEFSGSEAILLNTADKTVDWEKFGNEELAIGESKLNDTGITQCADRSTSGLSCPVSDYPGQDAEYGRDVTHNDDSDGHAGFSFTKLDANGDKLPANAGNWSCVKDNVTGLIWEVKQRGNGTAGDEGLHDAGDRYTWYTTDTRNDGGSAGYQNDDGGICHGYRSGDTASYCNTEAYTKRVNTQGLCGAADWRLPTREELRSLVRYDVPYPGPAIDAGYFPNTINDWYWSSLPSAGYSYDARGVDFGDGDDGTHSKHHYFYVRLVRGGQ